MGRGRIDRLGLRSGLPDRLLPSLVGAMSFFAVLAMAGTIDAARLASEWQADTGSALTVQVPDPGGPAAGDPAAGGETRVQAVLALLRTRPDVSDPHLLSTDEMNDLLKPWLGADVAQLALPVPAVITGNWNRAGPPDSLTAALDQAAPGTLASTGTLWASRVSALTASIQALAAAVLVLVALVAAAVITVATRAGLAQRREAIEIIHGLGALDSDIAGRFAIRTTRLAAIGAGVGALLALPILLWLARLAAPFANVATQSAGLGLPAPLWVALPGIPAAAALIGWVTTQITVRGWLRRLV